ncbi:MAG: hypothetical protein HFI69_08795 [Lachnospiraceae bacterium]|nr:hypothetical protein [Lachnospiraceae bacterium]
MRTKKLTTLILTFILMVNSSGFYTGDAEASPAITEMNKRADDWQVTPDQAVKGGAENSDQKLEFGKKQEGRLLPGTESQDYELTLKSSGKLTVHLEGNIEKLSMRLTDENGKGWGPRGSTEGGNYTYQLKKGTYHYQVKAVEDTALTETGLAYAITAGFQSAKAKYENNTTRKQAVKLPLSKTFFGHLAQNAPTEYYKITLKRVSYLAVSINTQITDKTPETFVVSLYNKEGKKISDWENPDWVALEKKDNETGGGFGFGSWVSNIDGQDEGLREALDAGTYYIGVSIKRDENGKVPASARYGQYALYATSYGLGVELKLSHKTAEYTGKRIKRPKITLKEYPNDPYYDFWAPYEVKEFDRVSTMTDYNEFGIIKEIGRYCIGGGGSSLYNPGGAHAYTIFTVTPVQGKIKRLKSEKKGEVQVSLKKNAPSTGYQIQIARDKNFKKSRKTIKTLKVKETIKGLSSGKKYYVRIRNYKDVETCYCPFTTVWESIYGKWSKPRVIMCK